MTTLHISFLEHNALHVECEMHTMQDFHIVNIKYPHSLPRQSAKAICVCALLGLASLPVFVWDILGVTFLIVNTEANKEGNST